MASVIRTSFLIGAAALFAACNNSDSAATAETATETAATNSERTAFERSDDHAIGNPNAAVTVVEYASVSCGACANWHQTVYPDFKQKYVDTGKVRYVFREFLAGQAQMADAGFMIALCAADDKYFQNIKLQFDRQAQMFEFAQRGQLREAYINLAKASGLSEDGFIDCMKNEDLREQYMDRMQSGVDAGVTGTPSFFINGEKHAVFTLETIEAVILPLLGEDAPVAEVVEETPVPTSTEETTE